jgi:hypothetical protein
MRTVAAVLRKHSALIRLDTSSIQAVSCLRMHGKTKSSFHLLLFSVGD